MIVASTFSIDHFDFLGLRQVYLHLRGREYASVAFRTRGLYRVCRHPIMLGFLIVFWSTPLLTASHALFAAAMAAYIFLGVRFEERDLARSLGEPYRRYREEVPAILPLSFGRRKA